MRVNYANAANQPLRIIAGGILGARVPRLFHGGFRVFFTQQHGDNATWEILTRSADGRNDDAHDD